MQLPTCTPGLPLPFFKQNIWQNRIFYVQASYNGTCAYTKQKKNVHEQENHRMYEL